MNNVNKRLKNKSFNTFSASLGCVLFILYGIILDFIRALIPQSSMTLFLAILISFLVEAVFLFASLSVCMFQKVEFLPATNLNKKITYKTMLLCVLISIITLYSFSNLTSAFVLVLENLGYTQTVSNIVIPNFSTYILYVFLLCITPAVFEEIMFRGVILSGLKDIGKHKAVFLSALIFMLMHGGPDQTIHQFILGVILGYVFIASGSLLATIIIHFFNNFTAVTMLFVQGIGGYTPKDTIVGTTPWTSILLILAVGLVAALIGGYLIKLIVKRIEVIEGERRKKEAEAVKNVVNLESEKGKCESQPQEETNHTITSIMLDSSKQKATKIKTIVCFSAAMAYLVANWFIALVTGFMI